MGVVNALIAMILFLFSIFFFGDLETAIAGIGGGESLQPVLSVFPIILVGSLFIAIFYLGFRE